jgi:hypothetical protein
MVVSNHLWHQSYYPGTQWRPWNQLADTRLHVIPISPASHTSPLMRAFSAHGQTRCSPVEKHRDRYGQLGFEPTMRPNVRMLAHTGPRVGALLTCQRAGHMHAKKPRTYVDVGRGFQCRTRGRGISLLARMCAFVERRGCGTYHAPLGRPGGLTWGQVPRGITKGADVGPVPTSLGSGGSGRGFLTFAHVVVAVGDAPTQDVVVGDHLTPELRDRLRRRRCDEGDVE